MTLQRVWNNFSAPAGPRRWIPSWPSCPLWPNNWTTSVGEWGSMWLETTAIWDLMKDELASFLILLLATRRRATRSSLSHLMYQNKSMESRVIRLLVCDGVSCIVAWIILDCCLIFWPNSLPSLSIIFATNFAFVSWSCLEVWSRMLVTIFARFLNPSSLISLALGSSLFLFSQTVIFAYVCFVTLFNNVPSFCFV